jgi:1,4-alpha-glucan branching enzyme
VLSFLRYAARPGPAADKPQGVLACLANFSALPYQRYRVGLPQAGRWREVLNTDATYYGGTGTGNLGAVEAVAEPWHGRPASATVTLPPLGVLWLTPEPGAAPD